MIVWFLVEYSVDVTTNDRLQVRLQVESVAQFVNHVRKLGLCTLPH